MTILVLTIFIYFLCKSIPYFIVGIPLLTILIIIGILLSAVWSFFKDVVSCVLEFISSVIVVMISNPIFYPVLLIAFISIILFWSCIICGENPKVFFGEIKDMALKKVKELRNE